MAEVTDLQKAMLQNYQGGRLAHLAEISDHRDMIQALRKEKDAALLFVLIQAVAGIEDPSDAGAILLSAETDVKTALSAVGAVAMLRHSMK